MNREQYAKLTEEEKRIKVAELCGWITHTREEMVRDGIGQSIEDFPEDYKTFDNSDGECFYLEIDSLPDYLNDLNAMHEAEKLPYHGGITVGNSSDYQTALEDITGGWEYDCNMPVMFCATAAQRAEAFVLALADKYWR